MNICKQCGVELESTMEFCPLCGLSVHVESVSIEDSKLEKSISRNKIFYEYKSLTLRQKYMLFWEISGIIIVSGILATLMINLIMSKNFSWAKYNLIISLVLFANISFFTFYSHRPLLLLSGSFLSISALLLSIDLLSSNIGWGTRLGIPVLLSFYVLLITVLWLIKISRQKGFNILAVIFIAIGVFVICLEIFISLYFHEEFKLSWSIITGASIIPVAALLFFVHYRLKTGMDLKRFFHI